MKKLLVPLIGQYDPDHPQVLDRPALEAAFILARRLDAHVEALALIDPPSGQRQSWPFWLPGGGAAQLCEMLDEASAKRREKAAANFDAALASQQPKPILTAKPAPGFSVHFDEAIGEIDVMIGKVGRLADLLVLSSPDTSWSEPYTPLVQTCLADTGRPVLVAPRQAEDIGKSIAIAWDGSEAAARAIASGLELLKVADAIVVLSAEEAGKTDIDPNEIVEYLAWHGLRANAESIAVDARGVENAILDEALARGADTLMIGARLHTRLHRVLFGSMTERVVDRPRIAAFLG